MRTDAYLGESSEDDEKIMTLSQAAKMQSVYVYNDYVHSRNIHTYYSASENSSLR